MKTPSLPLALLLLLAALAITAPSSVAQGRPGSLVPAETSQRSVPTFTNLYSDPISSRKGDPITVVVNLSSDARQEKNLNTSKSASINTGTIASELIPDELVRNYGFSLNGAGTTHQGAGDVRDRETMTTTFTGEIVEVLPNNTMKIRAYRNFTQGKEKTTITLTGLIRPEDISNSNQINSTRIANLEVQQEGSGALSRSRNKGWLTQLYEWISPF